MTSMKYEYIIYYVIWILLCTTIVTYVESIRKNDTHTHTHTNTHKHTHRYLVQRKADVRTRSNKGKLARELAADVQTVAAF